MHISATTLPLLLLGLTTAQAAEPKPQQVLIISFDGAHDNALWQMSRDMAKRTGAHFTYFLSCTFEMGPDQRRAYQAPHQKRGRSNVGFAQTADEVKTRLGNIWQAHLEGHDIGSHACGHFDGTAWSKDDWKTELSTFRTTLRSAWSNMHVPELEPQGWADFVDNDIIGFRAPYLSIGKGLLPALKASGFRYDASLVTKGPALPQDEDGMPRFGLPLIPEGPGNRNIIGMDYNLFIRHSAGFENRSQSAEFEDRSYKAFKAAFDKQYDGDRTPVQFGFHFVEMNGGAYWRALDRLLTDVCHRPDVACISYADYLSRQKTQKAENSAF